LAHIPDGVLSTQVLIGGGLAAAAALALSLRAMDERALPRVAIVSAGFFAISLFAIPVGPASIHLLLGGLMGLILGPAIFAAVFAALLLQAMMFGFGGLTTLGVNTINVALPGALAGLVLRPLVARASAPRAALIASLGSAFAVIGAGLMVAGSLALSSSDYETSARVMIATYAPLTIVEALIAGSCVSFVKKVKPDLFDAQDRA
jgi:cobalt/nickel transport system permease protein